MEDFFRFGDEGAEEVSLWGKAAMVAASIVFGLIAVLDIGDSLSSSSPWFAAKQYARHATGRLEEGESEAQVLLDYASREAELPGIGRARVWASDKMASHGANGMFNPVVYKITLGEGFAHSSGYEQRWLVFHEAGHIASFLTSRWGPARLPQWTLSDGAWQAMESSILYKQAFAESFADVFAAALALRLDPGDPIANSEIRRALSGKIDSISIAHDTQPALALASGQIHLLATLRGASLLSLVDAIASKGAAKTVGEWGAEREALCLQGWRGWARWARDGAHQYASNPWLMAAAEEGPGKDGSEAALAELMGLSTPRGWKRAEVGLAWQAYSERAHSIGERPEGSPPSWASLSSSSPMSRYEPNIPRQNAWAMALAEYEAGGRNSLRYALSYPFALLGLFETDKRPSGCRD